jgi:hypothetical protein
MANLIVSAIATWNGKALSKGKKDVSAFDKSITKLGKTFTGVFAAGSLMAFSKKAINAFAADEASAKSLELQLINTGNAFKTTEVEAYIHSLERTYAVLTDLRAPFKTLLNVTGDIRSSQILLEDALNISAGTGATLDQVISAITAGLQGQTKGIKNLKTGIDANIIATGDMNKIMLALEERFKGQAAARLDTFAGKMDGITYGVKQATKAIGGGLVESLLILGDNKSVSGLSDDFLNMGNNIAFATVEMAKLIKKMSDFVSNPSFKAGIIGLAILSKNPKALIAAMGVVGLDAAAKGLSTNFQGNGTQQAAGTRVKDYEVSKKLVVTKKEELATLKAKAALQGLIDKYDVERIGLMAALNNATDEETKTRLAEKLAILDGNAAMAAKYLAERNAEQGLEELAAAADDAVSALDKLKTWDPLSGLRVTEADKLNSKTLSDLAGVLGGIVTGLGGVAGKAPKSVDIANSIINGNVNPNYPGYPAATTPYDPLSSLMATTADISSAGAYNPLSGLRPTAQDIQIYIDASNMIDSDRMVDVVQNAFLTIQRQGGSTVPAGAF